MFEEGRPRKKREGRSRTNREEEAPARKWGVGWGHEVGGTGVRHRWAREES